jgi:DNA-binding NtrC family response regulator
MTATARALLHAHRWPGNIRELDNVIAVAAALSDSGIIDCDDLPDYLAPGDLAGDDEAAGLRAALVACNWNVSEAARRRGRPHHHPPPHQTAGHHATQLMPHLWRPLQVPPQMLPREASEKERLCADYAFGTVIAGHPPDKKMSGG